MLLALSLAIGSFVPEPAQATIVGDELPELRSVMGRVVDAEGRPVHGAEVEVRSLAPRASLSRGHVATAEDGSFSLPLPPKPELDWMIEDYVEVWAAGFARTELHGLSPALPDGNVGKLVLHRPVELRGRVTDSRGVGIAGAEIHAALGRARAPHADRARRPPIAVTDGEGNFVSRSLPPGPVTLGASAVGFADVVHAPTRLSAGKIHRRDFVMPPERVATLHVGSSGNTKPVDAYTEPLEEDYQLGPWAPQERFRAFWRGKEFADAAGVITLHGLPEDFSGLVRVGARDFRTELVWLPTREPRVVLEPVQWLEFRAVRDPRAPPPVILEIGIHNGPVPEGGCGTYEYTQWAHVSGDSPAVQVLAPDHWRVAWNSDDCTIQGGDAPGDLELVLTDGTRVEGTVKEFPADAVRAQEVVCPAPARLRGVVRDAAGRGIQLRIGVSMRTKQARALSVVTDPEGRFEFDEIGSGERWFTSLDPRWRIRYDLRRFELQPYEDRADLVVIADEIPATPRLHGVLRIDDRPPGEPVLIALDDVDHGALEPGYPQGMAWTDVEGRFAIRPRWEGAYHVVPRLPHDPRPSGWRALHAEFPLHDGRWPWSADFSQPSLPELVIDIPAEGDLRWLGSWRRVLR